MVLSTLLSSSASDLLPTSMEEQLSSDFYLISCIQYLSIPVFFFLITLEATFVSQIKNDKYAICFLKITFCHGKEFLLPGCVPYTDSDLIIIDLNDFFLETEPDSRIVKVAERC